MTELVDLITDPKAKLATVFDRFIERLERDHKKDEEALDRLYENHRRKIHRRHLKVVSDYKDILNGLYRRLQSRDDQTVITFFERFLRTEDKESYVEVCEQALPVLRKVEEEGGRIDMNIKHYDSSRISSGGCLWSEDPRNHFSDLDIFFEGFDDDYEYKVVRARIDEKKKREEEAARAAEWRARELPSNETILPSLIGQIGDGSEPSESLLSQFMTPDSPPPIKFNPIRMFARSTNIE
jgi:hypothetical protein